MMRSVSKSQLFCIFTGGVNLQAALEQSATLFTISEGARPRSTKVLVVILDKKSDSSPDDIKDAASTIIQEGIRIIAVALGNEADPKELEPLAPNIDDLIVPKTVDELPDKIMKRAVNGESIVTTSQNGIILNL